MEPRDPLVPDAPCGLVRQDAYDYFDEALPPPLPEPRRRVIREHLEACPPCEAHFRSAAALQAALPLWEAPRATPGFIGRVVAEARRVPAGGESLFAPLRRLASRRITIPLPVVAAAAVLVIGALALARFLSDGGGAGSRPLMPAPIMAYSGDVAAPAALMLFSGPDPSVVSRVLKPATSQR